VLILPAKVLPNITSRHVLQGGA